MESNNSKIVQTIAPTVFASSRCETVSDWELFFRAILITGFLLIFIIGTFGNCLVVFLALRPTSNSTVNTLNRYIFNLGLADLLYIFGSVFFTITNYNRRGWLFGDIGCRLILCIDIVSMYVSVYILCIMSIERYVAVVHPMKSLRYRSPCCARRLTSCVWLSSIVLVSPIIIGMKLISRQLPNGEEVYTCDWTLGEFYRTYMYIVFITSFLAPSLFMAGVYSLLLFHFYRTVSPTRPASKDLKKSKRKVAKILFLIVVIYWVCYLPFWSYQIMILRGNPNFDQNNVLGLIVIVLSYLNSCLNPFLYTLLPKSFNLWTSLCHKYSPVASRS